MAEDLASLGIRIESSQVPTAADRLDRLARSAQGAEKATDILGRSFRTLKDSLFSLNSLIGGMTFAGLVTGMYSVGSTYEAAMIRIKMTSGATAQEMNQLRARIRAIGDESEYGATGAAQVVQELSKFGRTANESIRELPGILKLAKIGAMELNEAVDTTEHIMSAFSLTLEDQERINDILTVAANKSGASIGDMGRQIALVAPYAKNFGITIEQLASYIAVLSKQGADGGRSAMQLQMALQNLPKLLEDLGVDRKGKSLIEVIDAIKKLGVSAEEIEKKFPGRGAATIFRLANQKDLIESIQQAEAAGKGTAEAYFQALESTSQDSIERLYSVIKGEGIDIFESYSGDLKTFVDDTTSAIKKHHEEIRTFVGEVAKFFKDLGKGVGDAVTIVNEFNTASGGMLGAVKTGWEELPDVVKDMGIIGAIVGGTKFKIFLLAMVEAIGLAKEWGQAVSHAVQNKLPGGWQATAGMEGSTSTYDDVQKDLVKNQTRLQDLYRNPAKFGNPGPVKTEWIAKEIKEEISNDLQALSRGGMYLSNNTGTNDRKGAASATKQWEVEDARERGKAAAEARAKAQEQIETAAAERRAAFLKGAEESLNAEIEAINGTALNSQFLKEKNHIEQMAKLYEKQGYSKEVVAQWKQAELADVARRDSAYKSAQEQLEKYKTLWDDWANGLGNNPYMDRIRSIVDEANKAARNLAISQGAKAAELADGNIPERLTNRPDLKPKFDLINKSAQKQMIESMPDVSKWEAQMSAGSMFEDRALVEFKTQLIDIQTQANQAKAAVREIFKADKGSPELQSKLDAIDNHTKMQIRASLAEIEQMEFKFDNRGLSDADYKVQQIIKHATVLKEQLEASFSGGFITEADYKHKLEALSYDTEKAVQDASAVGQLIDTMGDTFTGTLNEMVWGAKKSFAEILQSFGQMITEMIIREQMAKPLANWGKDLFAGWGAGNSVSSAESVGNEFFASAKGNIFSGGEVIPFARGGLLDRGTAMAFARGSILERGSVIPFARGTVLNRGHVVPFASGGVINRPIFFPLAKGMGLAGEAGPEAIMPLKRMPSGRLGVEATMKFATGGVFDRIYTPQQKPAMATELVEQLRVRKFATGGVGLAGEAGPEAIMPLKRLANGNLGVEASGGGKSGGGNVTVNIINNSDGTEATTKETRDANGNVQIDVMIDKIMAKKVMRGETHNALKQIFNLRVPTVGR